MTLIEAEAPGPSISPRRGPTGDRIFDRLSMGASALVLVLILAIAAFLLWKAEPAFRSAGPRFLTEKQWFPDNTHPKFGIASLAFGTVLSSVLALAMALPVAIGTALWIVEAAPRSLSRPVGYVVELLAAVPSVVYGLWAVFVLVPNLIPVERWFADTLGFIPLFHDPQHTFGRNVACASVVLAIMILPIVVSLSREILRQVPVEYREAAMALGATRWEVIRTAVLPAARPGLTGAAMLGLGRALGETIAVALVLSSSFDITWNIFSPGGNTIAANIATKFGEAGPLGQSALVASGLVLFAITLVVNMAARAFVYRGAAAEAHP
ncbi:MAG TPA: phosphate ABC transporter permease subunit PstC [Acidimicrobiales bacterium]|nr:phosphate ABC transporter permease subunit PstC [Acidimicrobiales bacterium]